MEHTKGPWKLDETWGLIVSKIGHEVAAYHPGRTWKKEETKANARLIAAAPELLEALESIVDSIDKGTTLIRWSAKYVSENGLSSCEGNVESARAAIAKARGECLKST